MKGRQDVAQPTRAQSSEEQVASRLVSRAVRRAQQGDRDALAFLYARYADEICAYARSIVHNQHDAEDVTQKVFAKLMGVIGKYEQRDVPFFAWMLRVTHNVAVDHLRKQRLVPVEEIRGADPGPDRVTGAARAGELKDALSTIPFDQREVLVLRHIAGLSPTEIMSATGRTAASVHGLHHRGRHALRAELTRSGAAPTTASSPRIRPAAP